MGKFINILICIFLLLVVLSPYTVLAFKPPILYSINKYLLPREWPAIDKNGNYIDDLLEKQGSGSDIVRIYLVFEGKPLRIYRSYIRLVGGKVLYEFKHVLNAYIVEIRRDSIDKLMYLFRQVDVNHNGYSDLLYIQAPRVYKPLMHWATREVNVRPHVWDLGYMGDHVRVAVLDTGIYLGGRGFNKSNIEFYDLVNNKTTPYDEVGHGTMVSYVIAGNITPTPELNEASNEILSTFLDYVKVENDQYYYITGPFMVTGTASELKFYAMAVLYNSSAQGLSDFISSAYLVHYPSYTVYDWGSYDQAWALTISYTQLANNYYLANMTLSSPLTNPPKGLYYVFVKFSSSALNYLAEVMGVCRQPLMTDNYTLHTGVAPHAGLVVFKVGDVNVIYTDLAAQALDTIASWNNDTDPSNDVNIASMSFGGPSSDPTFHQAIINAMKHGVLSVVAAGNDGPGTNNAGNTYPAAYPEVLTVAATNTIGNITDYSSQGGPSGTDPNIIKPDVAAPGGSYYGPLFMRDSDQDGELVFEADTNVYEIEYNDTQSAMGTSFATPVVSGLAALIIEVFREKGVWSNDLFHVLLVKNIIEASAHETYPLLREYYSSYSPTLERGSKDAHEGYGMVDGYAAIKLAEQTADLLRYWDGLDTSYYYEYGLDDNKAPFIVIEETLRQGVLYGVTSVNELLDVPLGSSATGAAVHFERYVWIVNGNNIVSQYGVRLIADTVDPANTDFDIQVYMYNSSVYDVVLLNRSSGGYGVTDEIVYITPPDNESKTDYIYYVLAKRATEDSAGGTAKLYVGPGVEARFVNGRYIWVNATAVSPNTTARYALIVIYYRNATGTYVHVQAIAATTNLNGFAHIEGYVKIIKGVEDGVLERLQDDYQWYVGVVFTSDKRSLANLTQESVVEGPIVVKVDIGEPTILDLSGPSSVYDHVSFKLLAHLILNDTSAPLAGATIYFYRSIDAKYWTLIGSNTTNATGYAELWVSEPDNGTVYYLAVYPGDNTTQYTWTGYAVAVKVYLRTNISINVSDTNPYTVEPVEINVTLTKLVTGEPLAGENVSIWISYDNGITWSLLYSGTTDSTGKVTYTHFFLAADTYVLKANYSGNTAYYILGSESSTITITSIKTPTNATITVNSTDLRVYDAVGFTIRLNYTYDNTTGPVKSATVYLELLNDTTWVVVDNTTTDANGYATLTYQFTRNGTYTFRINYPGNATYTQYLSSNITLLVKNLNTSIILSSVPVSGYVGQPVSATVRLIDERNRPVPGEIVILEKLVNSSWVYVTNSTTDDNGYATLTWTESSAGNYTYRVIYSGKNYVYNGSVSDTFNVSFTVVNTGLTLSANTTLTYVDNPVQLIARLVYDSTPIANETIYFEVWNGTAWVVIGTNTTDSNGYAYYIVTEHYAGNYTYRAEYKGSAQYAPSLSNNVTVEYQPLPTQLTLTLPSTAYTVDEVVIEATLTTSSGEPVADYTVYFWISTDGVTWDLLGSNATDSTGKAVYRHVFWVNGTYYIKANFTDPGKTNGTWRYNDTESNAKTINISLTPVDISLTTNTTEAYVNQSIGFTVVVTDVYGNPLPNITVEIYYNGTLKYTLTTEDNGSASWAEASSAYMIYEVKVHYTGNQTYNSSESTPLIVEWKPLPTNTTLTYKVFSATLDVGSTVELIARVLDTIYEKPVVGYDVEFWVSLDNGTTWNSIGTATTDQEGYAKLNYTLTADIPAYYFKATFTDPDKGVLGSWVYNDSESDVAILYTGKIVTELSLTANTTYTYVGESVELIARLTMSNGTPVSGETIDFYVYYNDAWKYLGSSTTNESGYATYVVSSSTVDSLTYKAKYSGSDVYLPAESNNVTVTYDKRPVEITIVSISPSQPYVGDTIEITVKLTSLGDPVSYVNVYLYNDTVLLDTETTDFYGKAVFTIENAQAGVYDLRIVFKGTDTYQANETNYTLIVKHRIELLLTITHKFLENGSLLFILNATLLIDGKPYAGQLIRFYRKGSWVYIGSNKTDPNGVALLYYLTNQSNIVATYTFKAEYNSTTATIDSTSTTSSQTVFLPEEYWRPPQPEPWYLPLILLAILFFAIIKRTLGRRTSS